VAELKWLAGYSGQTTHELISLEHEYRIPSLVLAFEEAMTQKAGNTKLTPEETCVLAIEALEREVNNGGYAQFFINTPQFAHIIVASLLSIGCPRTAAITQGAIEALQVPDLGARTIATAMKADDEQRDAALKRCSNSYYNEMEPVAASLFTFIKTNKDVIRCDVGRN
jgi:hypothetical protein